MKTRAIPGRYPVAALDWSGTEKRPPTTLERRRGPDQEEMWTPMAVGNPTYRGPLSISASRRRCGRPDLKQGTVAIATACLCAARLMKIARGLRI